MSGIPCEACFGLGMHHDTGEGCTTCLGEGVAPTPATLLSAIDDWFTANGFDSKHPELAPWAASIVAIALGDILDRAPTPAIESELEAV